MGPLILAAEFVLKIGIATGCFCYLDNLSPLYYNRIDE
jgi:hypothetical protein